MATLVPVPTTFCVVPARAATTGLVAVVVAARPRFTTPPLCGVVDVARGAVREFTAARADVVLAALVVAVVAVPRAFARPVGRVAHGASADMPQNIKTMYKDFIRIRIVYSR